MEERDFIVSAVVTKVYVTDVKINAVSEEDARAQFEDMKQEIASTISDDKVEEVIVEEEGCFDPLTRLDD